MMTISAIVCTHNRARDLQRCLARFEALRAEPNLTWELIVVDNNSGDATGSLVREFLERGQIDIKYVYESRPGLGHARNAGITAASGNILAFTDDDCIVDAGWLASISAEFNINPALDAIGGRVELFDPRDRPVTIVTRKERVNFSSPSQVFHIIHGCNMAFRRETFDIVGHFDARFGAGTKLSSAEDLDFLYRVYKNRLKIVYSPDVLVYHNHGRRTDVDVSGLMKGYNVGRGAFYCKHAVQKDKYVMKRAYWETRDLIRIIGSRVQDRQGRRTAWSSLRYLLIGACHYWITSCGTGYDTNSGRRQHMASA